ncbi:MAG TPA: DUF1579 domain-containing protein [Thermoanaerobaculia bacterium]|nr:DUF1579 domain-containing protein [Thermoanaerobaculia bacterium]
MKTRTAVVLSLLALSLSVAPGIALAQGDKPAAPPGMDHAAMEAAVKAATPGEHHKHLQHMVGDWTYSSKMWTAPGQPAMDSKGTIHSDSILGGRYVLSVYKGDMMGQPFEGHSTDGYDNNTGKFVSSWVDNMGTGIMNSTGSCDAPCKVVTMTSEPMFDPMSGKKMASKEVTTWVDDNNFKFEMFAVDPAGGPEMKVMEVMAKRK